MFTRLVVLVLLALATVSVSTPAYAATLTVGSLGCQAAFAGGAAGYFYDCAAEVAGGTGRYTSYTWRIQLWSNPPQYYSTGGPFFSAQCTRGGLYTVSLTVRDSGGATASASSRFRCLDEYRDA